MTDETPPRAPARRPAPPWITERATSCTRCNGAGHYRGAITGRDVTCRACDGTGKRRTISGPALQAVSWPGATWRHPLAPADVQDLAMVVLAAVAALPWLIVLRG